MPIDLDVFADNLMGRTVRAAMACLPAERRFGAEFQRHAVEARLTRPARAGVFSLPWMGDDGRVRTDRGYYAVFGEGPASGRIIFRGDLDFDALETAAFLAYLSACLRGTAGAGFACGVARDPGTLSDGESMRLCGCFSAAMRELLPAIRAGGVWWETPKRERGYLELRTRTDAIGAGADAWATAAGRGLAHLAQLALRRAGKKGLLGKTAAVLGRGEAARAAAEQAARLGAAVTLTERVEPAEVYFLCGGPAPAGREAAEAIAAHRPDGVFEGAPMACSPECAARLSGAGLLFVPAIAAGAGGAYWAGLSLSDRGRWDAERALRDALSALFERIWNACPGDPYRGAYTAALETAAAELIRRGV